VAKAVEGQFEKGNHPSTVNIVYTSPSGKLWTQDMARSEAQCKVDTIYICGRFAGVDQRFIDRYVTQEYSIGDVILAGGELATLLMLECSLRLVPGVLGNQTSSEVDSFGEAFLGGLEFPSYTRPQIWEALAVPEVLTSGKHGEISKWRQKQSLQKTQKLRPDLITKLPRDHSKKG